MASIKDYARMCKSTRVCSECPLINYWENCCTDALIDHAEEAESIIDKWVAEHPVKTYLMDFKEKFPNARFGANGVPHACVSHIYGVSCVLCCNNCADCWNQPMEESHD